MKVTCPECDGAGTIPTTECCDAECRDGRCMNCGERSSGKSTCPTCKGEKEIDNGDEPEDNVDTTDHYER